MAEGGESRKFKKVFRKFKKADFDWKNRKRIGRGGFGKVYLVHHIGEERDVVVKTPTSSKVLSQDIKNELEVLRKIHMDYIVEVYGLLMENDLVCGIAMEHVALGSIDIVVQKTGQELPWSLQLRVMHQIAEAMQHLHARNILHLDLKTQNILMDDECNVKVSDFGLSKIRQFVSTSQNVKDRLTAETPYFIAPEYLSDRLRQPSRKTDVYAFAITMWQILTGASTPFPHWPTPSLMEADIIKGHRPPLPQIPQSTQRERRQQERQIRGIMWECWDNVPKQRPHFTDILPDLRALSDEMTANAIEDAKQLKAKLIRASSLFMDSGDSASEGATAKGERIDGASKMDTTIILPEVPDHDQIRQRCLIVGCWYRGNREAMVDHLRGIHQLATVGPTLPESNQSRSPTPPRERPKSRSPHHSRSTHQWINDRSCDLSMARMTLRAGTIASSSPLIMDSGDSASKGATAKAERIDGASKMDTTKGIREAPAHVREEYYTTIEELFKPEVYDRNARVRIFEEQRKAFSPDTEKHFKEQTQEREKILVDFMGIVFPEAYVDHFKSPLPEGYPIHNHTKDALFAFLIAFHFDILKTTKDKRDELLKHNTKPLMDEELIYHYCLDPHHPEREQIMGIDCTDFNIFEMAMDMLARNVQFNHGELNMDHLRRSLPKFYINDTEGKQKSYIAYVEKYQEFVSRRSKELYFDKE